MSIATLPRPVLLGIVGVVLIGGVFLVTHKPSSTSSSTPAPSQTPQAAQSPASKAPSKATPANPSKTGPASVGLPTPVKTALDAHKVVVVLFWNPRGVDDRSVKASLDSVSRHKGKVAVFSDRVENLSRYTRIMAAASISTTPSLVVVNRKGQAEVINGYLDRQTVAQYVRNALRR
jgi:cytoskeletal protein RodZ